MKIVGKSKSYLLVFIFWLGFIVNANAAKYFFTQNGDGDRNGKSLSNAWPISSFNDWNNWASDPMLGKISPGDTVYISGKVTLEETLTPRASGSYENARIEIRGDSSTQGGIDAVVDIRHALSGTWAGGSLNRWNISISGNPRRMWFTKSGGNELEGQQVYTLDDVNSEYEWYYQTTSSSVYIYAGSNPSTYFSSVKHLYADANSNSAFALVRSANYGWQYINITHLTVYGGTLYSIGIIGGSNNKISYCNIGNSVEGIVLLGVNDTSYSAESNEIAHNNVDSQFVLDNSNKENALMDGIIIYDGVKNTLVHNNVIKNWGHAGVALYGSNPAYSANTGNLIYNNDISGPDVEYCPGITMYGEFGLNVSNKFYKNKIHDLPGPGIVLNGLHNEAYSNLICNIVGSPRAGKNGVGKGLEITAWSPNKENSGIHDCSYNKAYNNTVYHTKEAGIAVVYSAFANGTAIAYNEIYNNILYETAYNTDFAIPYSVYYKDSDDTHNNTIKNNLIYSSLMKAGNDISYRGKTYTVSKWADAVSNGDAISGNNQAIPLVISSADFHLQPGSPAINTGVNIELTSDFDGNPIIGLPDIGAYEYQGRPAAPSGLEIK